MANSNPWGLFAGRPIQSVLQALPHFEKHGIDPTPLERSNRYVCPRGAMPGHAEILGLGSDVLAWQQLTQLSSNSTLILGCDQNQISVSNMVFLSADLAVPGAQGDANALYFCHLADVRWLMNRAKMFKAYNVRSLATPTAEYWPDTENPNAATLYSGASGPGTGPWTWPTMLGDIWSQLPASGKYPPAPLISGTPGGANPERFRFIEQSPIAAYSEALMTFYDDLAYNPATNTFSIVSLGAPDSNFSALQGSLTGSLLDATFPIDSNSNWFPASVDVLFLALYPGAPEQSVTEYPYYVLNTVPASFPSGGTPMPGTVDCIFAPLDAQMACCAQGFVPNWAANTAYNLGQKIQPSPANGHTYVCTTAGTSGGVQPVFITTTGSTTTDNAVIWTESTIYPTNIAAMRTLATSLVAGYIQALDQAWRRKVWIYDGVQAFVPGSLVGQVEWRLGIDGATTTVSAVAE